MAKHLNAGKTWKDLLSLGGAPNLHRSSIEVLETLSGKCCAVSG